MHTQDEPTKTLNYLAHIVLQGFESQHSSPAYLEEKRARLSELDKWGTLQYLWNCDAAIQEHVARAIGVNVSDLRTAIQVIGRC